MKLKIPDEFFNEEELENTPRRWDKFMKEWLIDSGKFELTVFDNKGYDQMISWLGSEYSMCAHHCIIFELERVLISYIPNKKIVGLSKLPRVVAKFAHKPQLQERLTEEIADYLYEKLKCKGVLVAIKGRHLCCAARGVRNRGVMITTALKGVFKKDNSAKGEALKNFYENR